MTIQEKVELFFKLPLKKVISELHWKEKRSLNSLARECGVSRQALMHVCKTTDLKWRSVREATGITENKGKNHWAFGLKAKDDSRIAIHKDRMTKNNPSLNFETRVKTAASRSKYFKNNPLPQETAFANIAKRLGVDLDFQVPFGPYVVDFLWYSTVIEIDSTDKWTKRHREAAAIKDEWLRQKGLKVIRINKRWLSDLRTIRDILKANKIIL